MPGKSCCRPNRSGWLFLFGVFHRLSFDLYSILNNFYVGNPIKKWQQQGLWKDVRRDILYDRERKNGEKEEHMMEKNGKKSLFSIEITTGSLWKNILLFSLPLMMTQVLEVLFNLSDVAIAGKFADYLALGHVHAFGGVQQAGRTFWAYPGCPEGRGFDELGDKGFLTGTVEPGQVKLTFAPFARHRYQWLTADVTGVDPLEALRRELPPHPEADIFRMVLTGETEEPPRLDALYDALSPDCFYLELQDRTTRCRDLWEHCGEDTLRGLFLRDLRQRYDAAPEEEKPRLLQAARFGLAALENREL